MEFLRQTLLRNRQFVLYCIIGAGGATLDFLIYSALVKLGGVNFQVANACGYGSGTVLSFTLNSRFNFKPRDRMTLRFVAFCLVGLLGLAVSAEALHLLIDRCGYDKYVSKLAAIALVVLLQYNLNRIISFRRSKSAPDE
jgi:putative flippase GtrA